MKIVKHDQVCKSGDLEVRVSVHLNVEDDFFDDWIRHEEGLGRKVDEIGINEFGVRYVVIHSEFYYNVDDIVEAYRKIARSKSLSWKERGYKDVFDRIRSLAIGIDSDGIKDVMKELTDEEKYGDERDE